MSGPTVAFGFGGGATRLRGANVTIKPTTTSPGWRKLWGAEWDYSWVKGQIDQAVSVGANCIRIIGAVNGIVGGHYTRATYHARVAQVIEYCQSLGLGYYLVGAGDYETTRTQATLDELIAVGLMAQEYGNVIAYDVFQEWNVWLNQTTDGSASAITAMLADLRAWATAIRQAGVTLPLTYSSNTTGGVTEVAQFCDYADFHVYNPVTDTTLDSVAGGKEFIIGEFGANVSVGQAAQETRYNEVKSLVTARTFIRGAFQWAITDQSASDAEKYGMFDANGVERTYITNIFKTFPLTRT